MNYKDVYMVRVPVAPVGALIGKSIHLTKAEAIAAMPAGGIISTYGVRNPEETVRIVSARLRGEHKRGLRRNAEAVAA